MTREWLAPLATYNITTLEQDGEYSFTSTLTSDKNDDLVKMFRSHLMAMKGAHADNLTDETGFDQADIERLVVLHTDGLTTDQYLPLWTLYKHEEEDWFTHVIVRITPYSFLNDDELSHNPRKIVGG